MASILATLAEVKSAIATGLADIGDDGLRLHIDNMDAFIREYRGAHPTNTASLSFNSRRAALFGLVKTQIEYVAANGDNLPDSDEHKTNLRNFVMSIYNGDNARLNLPVITSTDGHILATNGRILATGSG